MNEDIYSELQRIARDDGYVIYSEIAPLAHLNMSNPSDRDRIGQLLDEINRHEYSMGHPLLSAVVIHKENNMPGAGFFKLARELGLYTGNDDLKFFLDELKRVHAFWQLMDESV